MATHHLDELGRARMVSISDKPETPRRAVASGFVHMSAATLRAFTEGALAKGDAIAVARVAGIAATKRCADWIALCHPIRVTHVQLEIVAEPDVPGMRVRAEVCAIDRTGPEMEAMAAVAAACLSLYDMGKGTERGMSIEGIALEHKSGGAGGEWNRVTPP